MRHHGGPTARAIEQVAELVEAPASESTQNIQGEGHGAHDSVDGAA